MSHDATRLVSPATVEAVRRALRSWFAAHARELPWRAKATPYRVWVSEVMLQQTQVTRVEKYFAPFVSRFPSIAALARAPLDDVLHAWSGLGYYRRAEALHAAARHLVAHFHGKLPRSAAQLLTLPGFGAYTAGAVASIAFGEPVPAVDANAMRVLSRLAGRTLRPQDARSYAGRLAAKEDAGAVNQALMDVGATICLTRAPRCPACPMRRRCRANALGTALSIPKVKSRRPKSALALTAALVTRRGRVLFAQRRRAGLFAGLWEFPAYQGGVQQMASGLGADSRVGVLRAEISRELTHLRVTVRLFEATIGSGLPAVPVEYRRLRWCTPDDIARLPVSSAARELLRSAGNFTRPSQIRL